MSCPDPNPEAFRQAVNDAERQEIDRILAVNGAFPPSTEDQLRTARLSGIHMRIVQENELIVDLPEWTGPVPRVGEYIFHPPYGDISPEGIAGCVKTVTWRTHDRDRPGTDFKMTSRVYVELVI